MDSLIARRLGRIAFGVVVLAGLACLLWSCTGRSHWYRTWSIAPVLIAIWLAAFAVHAMVRAVAMRWPVHGPGSRWFTASVVVPAVAITLTLPITLHMPFVLVFSGWDGFDTWFEGSMFVTGPAHVVAALMVAVRAHQLVAGKPAWSPRLIIWTTIVVSCIPFVVLLALPPVVVGITAIPFLPLFRRMDRLVARERLEMQALPELPVARVI